MSINFPTLFTSEKITKPCERTLDPDIDTKMPLWVDSFLTYLLRKAHEYTTKKKQALHIPTQVTMTTSAYQEESDFYQNYYNERIVKTGCSADRLEWTHVWIDFHHWFRRSHGLDHQPKKVEVRKRFESDMFQQKLSKGVWVGILMPSHQFSSQN